MEKFIPYEKLSKKKKRELNKRKRKDWGNISPVTKVVHKKSRKELINNEKTKCSAEIF